MCNDVNLSATNFDQIDSISSDHTDISADLKKYFLGKMEKKGIYKAEKMYDRYLQLGFSPKAAIALTDRSFFPDPHKGSHGNYLRRVIGDELFQKEQAARKGKGDWTHHCHAPVASLRKSDEKINSIANQAIDAKSRTSSAQSKKHKYHKAGSMGGYLLGITEIIAGGALILTGGVVEIASCGTLTVGVGFALGTGASLIGLGLATTAANASGGAKDIGSYTMTKNDPGTPVSNDNQNKQSDDAKKEIEKKLGRKLTRAEERKFHDYVSGQEYGYHEMVEEGYWLLGGS